MSTRPRLTFDADGSCSACQWSRAKSVLDWDPRREQLTTLLDSVRSEDGRFDCLVPVSGGKDGSYVAHQLKHEFGMNPLCVTVRPPLETDLGRQNLLNFIDAGFDHVHVSPNPETMRRLNRYGFEEKGFPYYGWLTGILTGVIRTAIAYEIPLVFYGEDGEVEYGGSTETKDDPLFDYEYMQRIYLEGGHDKVMNRLGIERRGAFWWEFPEESDNGPNFTHWSYFENWDSYRNYLVAKEQCGLLENEETNAGTFTNFAQNDQLLYELHAYLMYLKFGFGRATQDVGIEVRRGAMTREQGLNLVRLYDGTYPEAHESAYCEYYDIDIDHFNAVLDRWVNQDLFEKVDGRWKPTFTPA